MIALLWEAGLEDQARALQHLNLPTLQETPQVQYGLRVTHEGLEIVDLQRKQRPIRVDFHLQARERSGGDILRAVNAKAHREVVDATGGLGRDAFTLAQAGCQVTVIEKSPIVHALLQDGLQRAADLEAAQRIQLLQGDSVQLLQNLSTEVVYLDPMYPPRKKDALPKLEMQVFHALLGHNTDEADLLQAALQAARKRVVVKRPLHALALARPGLQFKGKTTRFDVYLK